MKKIFYVVGLCIFITGCSVEKHNTVKEKGTEIMTENKLPREDFELLFIEDLTLSSEEKEIQDISKIYFYEINNLKWENQIAVDLGNKGLYINPKQSSIGLSDFDYELSLEDTVKVEKILKKSNIMNWKIEYLYGDSNQLEQMGGEGYNWKLCIQYKDGTAFYKYGKGTDKNEIEPDGYKTFVNELTEFVKSKDN